jgi:hypothetical protein
MGIPGASIHLYIDGAGLLYFIDHLQTTIYLAGIDHYFGRDPNLFYCIVKKEESDVGNLKFMSVNV